MTRAHTRPAPPPAQRVLVVEDLADARESCRELLALALPHGVEVDAAADGAEALTRLAERPYSLVVTDLRMPKVSGLGLLREMRANRVPATVIVTTGLGTVKEAVEAMRLGAYDYLEKPLDPERLVLLAERVLRERALRDEVAALRHRLRGGHGFPNLLAKSPRMLDVFDLIVTAADTASGVLIEGEAGTGKEEVARAVHRVSAAHRTGPFVAVECDALSGAQLEADLFGPEGGAAHRGAFGRARGGTLFLSGVDHVPAALQARLCRALRDGEHDVRVVASTRRSPESLLREGLLREDLFYRMGVIRIELPPLRDRREDIPLLAAHFAERFARPDRPPAEFSADALARLAAADWPGNVRQLRAAIERACAVAPDGVIGAEHLPKLD